MSGILHCLEIGHRDYCHKIIVVSVVFLQRYFICRYLFNDAEVKPFDPAQIASECFGGEMTVMFLSRDVIFSMFTIKKSHGCKLSFKVVTLCGH